MQIWVDADACPGAIRELLFRAAKRTRTKVTLVANQQMSTPRSEFIGSLLVGTDMNAPIAGSSSSCSPAILWLQQTYR